MDAIKLQIDIFPANVTIETKVIDRPSYIGPSEWVEFWEEVNKLSSMGGFVETRTDYGD